MDNNQVTKAPKTDKDLESRLSYIEVEYWQLRDKYEKLLERVELLEKAAGIFGT